MEEIAFHDEEGVSGLEVPGGSLRSFGFSPDGERLLCGCDSWDDPRHPHADLPARLVGWKR
ncbi:MAG: hypothetical protein K2W96_08795, partial [Gemmataceae bacterium]|nr:hypothetical protein [Gemmataceae bacterium]